MKNGSLKKIIVLVLLINNMLFASSVQDDDELAFVTKSEYDKIKTSLSSQIDNYEVSVDDMIDKAIVLYLAGIQMSKESILNNYYKNLKDNINFTWTKRTDYMDTASKPYPEAKVKLMQHSLASGGIWTAGKENKASWGSGNMTNLPYGMWDTGKSVFTVEKVVNMQQVVNFNVFYGYAYYSPINATGKYPDFRSVSGNLSLIKRSYARCNSYNPETTSGVSSYRHILFEMNLTESIVEEKQFIFAPLSTALTYCYDYNSTEPVNNIGYNESALAYSAGIGSNDTEWGNTVTGAGGSYTNVNWASTTTFAISNFANASETFGWMNDKSKQNDLVYKAITNINKRAKAIKYGVRITDVKGKGTVSITFNGSDAGQFRYKLETEPTFDFSTSSSYDTYNITGASEQVFDININEPTGKSIYGIFVPNADTGNMNITEIKFTKSDD